MSHFSVMVIGPDYEAQLAPYHEYECTGRLDKYVVDVDVTNEVQAELDDSKTSSYYDNPHESMQAAAEYLYGEDVTEHDGKFYSKTNPNARWDWYTLGGRWSGRLLLKTGESVDQANKGDVDFAYMRDKAEDMARNEWRKVQIITKGKTWTTWDDMRMSLKDKESIDNVRKKYFTQPAVKALNAHRMYDVDDFIMPEDAYAQRARDMACGTFAYVKDSKWYERGKMGYFGSHTEDVGEGQWYSAFNAMLDALPDDTLLSIVDCHI